MNGDRPQFNASAPVKLYDADWYPMDTGPEIVKGSAMDLSYLNDAPAGKHGFVMVDENGDFVFETKTGTPARFYGANTNWKMYYGSDEDLTKTADRFARMGYNIVRLHSHDSMEDWCPGIFRRPHTMEAALDEGRVERFDFLVSKLKERGIYVAVDVFHLYDMTGIPEIGKYLSSYHQGRYLLPIIPEALEVWKEVAGQYLGHVNAYTGMALKNDPMLVTVSPWNEDLLTNLNLGRRDPSTVRLREFVLNDINEYLKAQGSEPMSEYPSSFWSTRGQSKSNMMAYYTDKTKAAFEKMKKYLKDDLGVRAVVGGINFINCPYVNYWRHEMCENFETHLYYQYSSGKVYGNEGISYEPTRMRRLTDVFSIKDWKPLYGDQFSSYYPNLGVRQEYAKPLSLTEWHDCFPGKGREEAGFLVGSIGAYHGWDVLNRFGFGLGQRDAVADLSLGKSFQFSIAGDPLAIASEYAGTLIFRTGCVRSAEPRFVIVWDREFCKNNESAVDEQERLNKLLYVAHMFKTVTVYADREEPFAVYRVTPDLTSEQIANGDIPEANRLDVDFQKTMKQVAAQFVDSLDNDVLKRAMMEQLEQNVLVTDTGELVFDLDHNSYMVNTGRLVSVSGTLNRGRCVFRNCSVECSCEKGSFMAASLDGSDIDRARRLVLMYITDVASETERIIGQPDGEEHYILGSLPTLARYETAVFRLSSQLNQNEYKAYRVALNGTRLEEIPVAVQDNSVVLALDTAHGFTFELEYTPDLINSV